MIRVLLAEDHHLVRAGFVRLLTAIEGIEVVGEAGDGPTALRLIEELKPDVAILDIAMPGKSGLDVLAEMPRDVKGIILSTDGHVEFVISALRKGATGYLRKTLLVAELETAIRVVASGGTFLSPPYTLDGIKKYLGGGVMTTYESLSKRQKDVLRLAALGYRNDQIADEMGVTVKTVDHYRTLLMKKLDVHNLAELTAFAVKHRVVSFDVGASESDNSP